jgi:hypothetical protein
MLFLLSVKVALSIFKLSKFFTVYFKQDRLFLSLILAMHEKSIRVVELIHLEHWKTPFNSPKFLIKEHNFGINFFMHLNLSPHF